MPPFLNFTECWRPLFSTGLSQPAEEITDGHRTTALPIITIANREHLISVKNRQEKQGWATNRPWSKTGPSGDHSDITDKMLRRARAGDHRDRGQSVAGALCEVGAAHPQA